MNPMIAFAAAIAVFTGIGAGIGICYATSKAAEGISRQPEAAAQIRNVTLLGAVLAEATAIYGLFVAILLWLKL